MKRPPLTRREWMWANALIFSTTYLHAAGPERGAQRLPIAKLQEWEALGYGMFLHFGISTYDGIEWSQGKTPAAEYHPDRLNVDQWIQVARDAGMKYAVLTTKHVCGFCLWPSRYTDYSVAASPEKTDVVEEFVKACDRHSVRPGFYYCSFDNHHTFGSITPDHTGLPFETVEQIHEIERSGKAYTTSVYQDFQLNQITELLTRYGTITEFWLDEPGVLGRGYRTFLYQHITILQPGCLVMANGSYGNVNAWDPRLTWPQDVIGYEPPGQTEEMLPPETGHLKWRTLEGKAILVTWRDLRFNWSHWFWKDGDTARPDAELLHVYQIARARGINFLFDVPPDKHGLISDPFRDALMRF